MHKILLKIGRSSIESKDFKKLNWLPIHEEISQCSLYSIYKLFSKNYYILKRYMFL